MRELRELALAGRGEGGILASFTGKECRDDAERDYDHEGCFAGASGLSEMALAEQAGTFSEMLLSSLERRALLHTLLSKGWAERFEDPLTDVPRFTITERGRLAMGAL